MDSLVRFDLLSQGGDVGIRKESGIKGIFALPRSLPSVRARLESQKCGDGEAEDTARVS